MSSSPRHNTGPAGIPSSKNVHGQNPIRSDLRRFDGNRRTVRAQPTVPLRLFPLNFLFSDQFYPAYVFHAQSPHHG